MKDFKKIDDHQIATLILTCAFPNCFLISFKKCLNCHSQWMKAIHAKEIRVKNGMFCRSENFCPQLGVSNNTHGTVYTNNSPTGVLTTGGQTPQTSSLSGSIDSHKMIYITFGAKLVGCI